jgi:hypothetical protein
MPSFATVTNGAIVQAQDINQLVQALNGAAGLGVPLAVTAVNDSVNFALAIKNGETTNSRALQVLRANNVVLLQADANGVVGSVDGIAAAAQLVNASLAQTLTNKTFDASSNILSRIANTVLGSSAASVSFTSIPSTYRHLILVTYDRSDTAATNTGRRLQFNGDTAASYYAQGVTGVAAATSAAETLAATGGRLGPMTAANASVTTLFSGAFILIPNYAQATNLKIALGVGFAPSGTGTGTETMTAEGFFWNNAAVINRVDLLAAAGNLVSGTTVTLYGLP